ncbi:MAG: hypothetical protein JWM04_2244, partial [Verrucomicrobiales bacterium]|nr:hypothetical protein [Verrucomicrobiales bacterium]
RRSAEALAKEDGTLHQTKEVEPRPEIASSPRQKSLFCHFEVTIHFVTDQEAPTEGY